MKKLSSIAVLFLFALAIGFFGSTIYVEQTYALAAEPTPLSCLQVMCVTVTPQDIKGSQPCPVNTFRLYSGTDNKTGYCCGQLLDVYCNPF